MEISVIVRDQIMTASPEALRQACSQGATCGCGRCMPCVVLELAKQYHRRDFKTVAWPAESAYWNRWDRIRYLLTHDAFRLTGHESDAVVLSGHTVPRGVEEACDVHL